MTDKTLTLAKKLRRVSTIMEDVPLPHEPGFSPRSYSQVVPRLLPERFEYPMGEQFRLPFGRTSPFRRGWGVPTFVISVWGCTR